MALVGRVRAFADNALAFAEKRMNRHARAGTVGLMEVTGKMTDREPRTMPPDAILAVLLMLIGTLILFDKLNLLHSLARFWPIALIGGGIALLLQRYDNPPWL